MNLAYISLAARMDDEEFLKMLSKVPDDTFIVIEDFDRSKVIKNANADNSNGPGLTEGKPIRKASPEEERALLLSLFFLLQLAF